MEKELCYCLREYHRLPFSTDSTGKAALNRETDIPAQGISFLFVPIQRVSVRLCKCCYSPFLLHQEGDYVRNTER